MTGNIISQRLSFVSQSSELSLTRGEAAGSEILTCGDR